ncbi:MAG: transglutaminase family protein [Sulfuricella sp.]|nr:transglutaminase family protein [Sulfuricella sp.]
MHLYLAPSKYIDFDHPQVAEKASTLAGGQADEIAIARRCFEFVRDEIKHSWDFKKNPVTCRASEVLLHGTGYCYAKSHLLAALLRANRIPAGLCYQRLSVGDAGPPYCLHGLNAVFLADYGWYRIDPRGNKEGIAAAFCPPREALAFTIREKCERDLPEIWAEPLPLVTSLLERFGEVLLVAENLPDIPITGYSHNK